MLKILFVSNPSIMKKKYFEKEFLYAEIQIFIIRPTQPNVNRKTRLSLVNVGENWMHRKIALGL